LFPFCPELVVNDRGDVPLPVLVHVDPPFVLTCHWSEGVGLPVAEALKLAVLPAQTAASEGLVVIDGIVQLLMLVVAVALLSAILGSAAVDETEAVFPIVPVEPLFTFVTSPNVADVVESILAFVHVTVPVPPTEGVDAAHPAGVVTDTNVVPAGMESTRLTEAAELGPALFTTRE
jgi:hypothetical protein